MKITVYHSDEKQYRLSSLGSFEMPEINTDINEIYGHPGDIEADVLNIHDDVEYQTVLGIGGAFTESAALAMQALPLDKQKEFIEAYFDKNKGIGYNFGRLSIASCDFSAEDYTYIEEGDEDLDSFDISRDKLAVFPMVKAAKEYADLVLFASPWSPPAYMKTNGKRIYGGHLSKKYYPLWAKYFRKYIDACKDAGIDIWAVTLQNEPRHTQMWESCLYSIDEEIEFLGYLGRELQSTGTKIFCYDHCRERVYERSKKIFESKNGKFCAGIAHHWYSGDHFGEIEASKRKYPGKLNIASEGCCAISGSGIKPDYELEFAEKYAHDIIGCFKAGLDAYCDWNLTLDEKNGPYHNREGRGCSADALVYCNKQTQDIIYRLPYYYVGHISKFVERGAVVVNSSSYTASLDHCAFKNPDGKIVLAVMNANDSSKKLVVRKDDFVFKTEMPPHSISTFIIDKELCTDEKNND